MNPVIKKFQFGQSTVTLETGRIARQASGAVLVTVDDDVAVLVAVTGAKTADPSKGFFPLSVHYQEKTYAAGKIPGGFTADTEQSSAKREGLMGVLQFKPNKDFESTLDVFRSTGTFALKKTGLEGAFLDNSNYDPTGTVTNATAADGFVTSGTVDKYKGVPPYKETRHYVERVGILADRYRSAASPVASSSTGGLSAR